MILAVTGSSPSTSNHLVLTNLELKNPAGDESSGRKYGSRTPGALEGLKPVVERDKGK